MRQLTRVVALCIVAALAGCASSGTTTSAVAVNPESGTSFAYSAANDAAAADKTTTGSVTAVHTEAVAAVGAEPVSAAAVPQSVLNVASAQGVGEYRIATSDVIEITVFRVPDLSKTVQVASSGIISLPLIGDVTAGGRTIAELEADIAARLKKDYLQDPDVSVFVKEAVSQRVTVEGAVSKPGVYPTNGSTTLLQVVALAGGLDRIADPSGIVVFRNVGGQRQVAKFNYNAVRKGTEADPVIRGGDVVVVDQSGVKAALRDVRESLGIFGLFSPLI